ncbi:MAG: RidA family protein [Rhodospirillaceae bacterium]|jgi:enamine deaminase RidA (YjgF/YER057c/UK114 family)|nr:RidA family protein [Rhodospirillaceae bacterium]MBT5245898.1 RidA family protein [Rhodospirillaceae bacterium]MBT5561823.1 RidA family protein [Rhodospirillaceae bacterium]MBT6240937.1 RidA family protein [Rhodospirillaceae bacterium]MBT7139104.1 RidA family protein [Rhodospirillaceae bacterium]
MAGTIEQRLLDMGVELPKPAAPAANYIPYVISGNLVFISGQVTMLNGELQYQGTVGDNFSVDDGYQAARICAINLLAQLKDACAGDLERVQQVVKLGGFVNCTADFTDQPKVINGASDLIAEVFGEAGKHARFAVGAPSLPLGVAVEVDGIFEIS